VRGVPRGCVTSWVVSPRQRERQRERESETERESERERASFENNIHNGGCVIMRVV